MELGKLMKTYVVEPVIDPVPRADEEREDSDQVTAAAKDDAELTEAPAATR